MNTKTSNYTITPVQTNSKWYKHALAAEINLGIDTDLKALEKIRINHPEILAYKARILAKHDTVKEYADWTSFLLEEYGPRNSCLSLGSGVGRIEKFLVNIGFAKKISTIELCAPVNESVRIHDPNISVLGGDLNFIQLEHEAYDFILCHGVLHHLINLEHILNEINLALRADGILLIYEYIGESRWQFTPDRIKVLKKILPGFDFTPPPIWTHTGFESIRSADILQLIEAQFGNTCDRAVSYGGVYFPFVICTKPEADAYMKRVVTLDDKISKEGLLPPCYHMGVYRKSNASPVNARPWSDEELRLRLAPSRPMIIQIIQALKRTQLWRICRTAKRAITH